MENNMTKAPTLTPLEALTKARTDDGFIQDGFRYVLDGPMGAPFEYLAPNASRADIPEEELEGSWYCTGEPGDEVTADTTWVWG